MPRHINRSVTSDIPITQDLYALSLATGVRVDDLEKCLDGELYPSPAHIARMKQALTPDELQQFLSHAKLTLTGEVSRFDSLPKGYHLEFSVMTKDLHEGDLLLKVKENGANLSHVWTRIDSIEIVQNTKYRVMLDGQPIILHPFSQFRIARPATSSLDPAE